MSLTIATLGPSGTCSEEAAFDLLRERGLVGNVRLCDSFEDAVGLVLSGEVEHALVAAAYTRLNQLIFENVGKLHIVALLRNQPTFVLAEGVGAPHPVPAEGPRVAAHRSPSPLLRRVQFPHRHVETTSNAVSARMAATGEAEFCISNLYGVNKLNAAAGTGKGLRVLETFGTIDMVWLLFERGAVERRAPLGVSLGSGDAWAIGSI